MNKAKPQSNSEVRTHKIVPGIATVMRIIMTLTMIFVLVHTVGAAETSGGPWLRNLAISEGYPTKDTQDQNVIGDTVEGAPGNWFKRVTREVRPGEPVTVFTDDGAIFLANRPLFDFSSSTLYMRSETRSGVTGTVLIPFENISRITYSKPSAARWGLAILGFGIGAVAGGMAGAAMAPESDEWLDFDAMRYGIFGAVIGGMLGTACGYAIGDNMKTTVTLECR